MCLVSTVTRKNVTKRPDADISMISSDKACHQGVKGRYCFAHIWYI